MVGGHVRGVVRNFERNLPSDEQHVSTSGLSVALVHGFPHCCILVLHCCLVVAAVNLGASIHIDLTATSPMYLPDRTLAYLTIPIHSDHTDAVNSAQPLDNFPG